MSKVFNQSHYDSDDNAKNDVIAWLGQRGFMAWVNDDQYGIDVQGFPIADLWEFEVEVKHNWKGAVFPFNTVHFSARKIKFVKPNKRNWFVMLNHERSHLFMVSGEVLELCKVVKKDTIYTTGETFIEVPIKSGSFHSIEKI